jgi:hypothetical protein
LIDKGNIIVVYLTNTRSGHKDWSQSITDQINKALGEVKTWPRHNLFHKY